MDRKVHPRLVICTPVRSDLADYIVIKLMEVEDGPTFTVTRGEAGMTNIWTSKRTYDRLKSILKVARREGEFDEV